MDNWNISNQVKCCECGNNFSSSNDENIYCQACHDIYDMEDCYNSVIKINSYPINICERCHISSNEKTLFRVKSNGNCRTDRSYHVDIECRECFFSFCTACGSDNVDLKFPNSVPNDCICNECWSQDQLIMSGECSKCGVFDYLDFKREFDESSYVLNNGHFEKEYERYDADLFCWDCLKEFYEKNPVDEYPYSTDLKSCICDSCKLDTNSLLKTSQVKKIVKEKNVSERFLLLKKILDKKLNNCNVSYDPLMTVSLIENAEMKIHEVFVDSNSICNLPNSISVEEYMIYYMNDLDSNMELKISKKYNICTDCFVYGIIDCLLENGTVPRFGEDIYYFIQNKTERNLRKIFNKSKSIISILNLCSSYRLGQCNKRSNVGHDKVMELGEDEIDQDFPRHKYKFVDISST